MAGAAALTRWRALWASPSWRGDLVRAFAAYLATRAMLAVFVYLTAQHYVCHGPRCLDRAFFPHNLVANALFQWDAYQYRALVKHGYYLGAGFDTTAPYFPGFPVAAWLVGKLVGSPMWGGIAFNHACSIAGATLLARLVRRLGIRDPHGAVDDTAREATLFWLGAPLTFFFCVFLTEALFAAASVALLWAVASGRWKTALLAGLAATATRNAGVMVVAAALVLAWERRREVPVPWHGWLCVAAGPTSLVALSLWQAHAVGDALAWVHVQARWHRGLVPPWRTLREDWLGLPPVAGRDVDKMYRAQEVLALLLVAPLFAFRRRLGIPWALLGLGVAEWLLPLCSRSLISSARYQAANVYFAVALPALLAPRPTLRALAWLGFGMVLAWYASTYSVGNWAS